MLRSGVLVLQFWKVCLKQGLALRLAGMERTANHADLELTHLPTSTLPVLGLMDMCLQAVLPTGYASLADLKTHYVAESALELLILLFK